MRQYPPAVTLIRRAERGPAAAPATTGPGGIETWLLGEAAMESDLLALLEGFLWRLVAAGFPLARASMHVGTLHPQLIGFAWIWLRADGFCDEVKVAEAALRTESYQRNPMKRVIEDGETIRRRPQDPAAQAEFPLMKELAEGGITDYLALPLGGTAVLHNAMTMGTAAPGGFTEAQVDALLRLYRLFALHVEGHIMRRIAENISAAYLGAEAGRKVLEGAIRRGAGEPVRAIIWVSDLRGFTALSDRLSGPDMLAVLNAYFERLAGAVLAGGGDVLKFMGDGMLAVFPFTDEITARSAARRALTAAEAAMAALAAVNRDPPAELIGIEGWNPLASGIALHEGEVFFGNIGAPARLDFTVIGPAVNEAARVEALTKTLGEPILVTAPVIRHLGRALRSLGTHALRGVGGAMELFAPAQGKARR